MEEDPDVARSSKRRFLDVNLVVWFKKRASPLAKKPEFVASAMRGLERNRMMCDLSPADAGCVDASDSKIDSPYHHLGR